MQHTPSSRPGWYARNGVRWAIGAILLILGTRLLVAASRLSTAPGALRVFAQDATLGWLGLCHRPIDQQDAARQAEFWLAESNRVFNQHRTSEMARGAAWMLDAPGTAFYFRHLRRSPVPGFPFEMDQEAIAAENLNFARATKPRCVEFAQLATELAPDGSEAWRSRATLLFDSASTPRTTDWRDVLAEARARDPNNALYDYLQAAHIWQANATYADDGTGGAIADAGLLEESLKAFARGQPKNYFPATLADWPTILKFLERTTVPRHEHPEVINGRQLQADANLCELGLLRMQFDLLEQAPLEEQLSRLEQTARVAQQVATSGDLSGAGIAITVHQSIAGRIGDLLQNHRAALPAATVTKAEQLRAGLLRQKLIVETASQRLPQLPQRNVSSWDMLEQYLVRAAAESSVLLASVALVCWLGTRWASAQEHPQKLSWVTHVICWFLSFAIVVAVLGWQASRVHDLASQQLFTRIVMVTAIVLALSIAVLMVLYLSGWRFSLRQMLVGPLLLGGCIVLVGVLGVPRIGDIDPAVLQTAAPAFVPGSFNWAMYQFTNYSGATVAALFALLLVGLLVLRRAGARPESVAPSATSVVRSVLAETGHSAAVASLVALALFLLIAPGALQAIEADYDAKMAWLVELEPRRSQFAKEVSAIESDAAQLAKIDRQVAQQLQSQVP